MAQHSSEASEELQVYTNREFRLWSGLVQDPRKTQSDPSNRMCRCLRDWENGPGQRSPVLQYCKVVQEQDIKSTAESQLQLCVVRKCESPPIFLPDNLGKS